MNARRAALALSLSAIATAGAQELQPWSPPFADPLRWSSLPLETTDALALAPGAWEITLTPGYFNLWSGSWHTATIHRELGLEGKPLRPEELRTLEGRHRGDDIYRFDVEGSLTEVRVAYGLGRGVTVSLAAPWIDIGTPHWDAISQDVHRALGWGRGSRDLFAHGQTLAYVWSPKRQRAIEGWEELGGSGVGDLRLTISGAAGGFAGVEHRWAVALDAPTGDEGTLFGSGGWDAGVRWFAAWRRARTVVRAAVGYTRLDGGGGFLGAERDDTWHALLEYLHLWGERADLLLAARADTSPLASFSAGEPGEPALLFTFGVRYLVSGRTWLAVALGENLIPQGVNPDFTLQLQLGVRGPSPAR